MESIEQKEAKKFREKARLEQPDDKFTKQIDKIFIDNIEQVKEEVEKHFPEMWEYTEACLSVVATLKIKDLSNCVALILQGAPSSTKTTLLDFFVGHHITYLSDTFTPQSFVSHANKTELELMKIDLLPKIKHKCMITPEMNTLFGVEKEKLISNLSKLCRVLDGSGLSTDSGIKGHRGYEGDYRFVWLGATVPLENKIWKWMGRLGARLYFLNYDLKQKLDSEIINDVILTGAYREKVENCKIVIHKFLDKLFSNGMLNIEWDHEKEDSFCREYIVGIVQLLRRLRAPLQIWSSEEKDGYSYSSPIIEEPERATSVLYDIARGRALLYGRNYLTKKDLPLILKIGLSSMPKDRADMFNLLLRKNGVLETEVISHELKCSINTAHRIMKTLDILELVDLEIYNIQNEKGGRPFTRITLKEEYRWLFSK